MTSNNEKLNHIHWNVETKVKEGCYEKLNLIIDKMEEYVKNNEPDTLGYSFYFNSDKDKLFIHEYYTNNKAALKHMDGFNQFAEDFFGALDIIKVDMFGPCNETMKSIFDNFNTIYWSNR